MQFQISFYLPNYPTHSGNSEYHDKHTINVQANSETDIREHMADFLDGLVDVTIKEVDCVSIVWCVEDVELSLPYINKQWFETVYDNLTSEKKAIFCMQVLNTAKRHHDASVGINWDVLETVASEEIKKHTTA